KPNHHMKHTHNQILWPLPAGVNEGDQVMVLRFGPDGWLRHARTPTCSARCGPSSLLKMWE
ncbi:hypothetical protein V3C41_00005, partial [Paenarthrobacter nicotinovorans]